MLLHQRLQDEYREAEGAGLQKATALARGYADQMAHTLQNLDHISLDLRYHWQKSPGDLNFADQLQNGRYPLTSSLQAAVFDRNGTLLGAAPGNARPISIAAREDFIAISRGQETRLVITAPLRDALSNREVVCFSRALLDSEARPDGLVSVCVPPGYLASFQDRSSMSRSDFVAAVRPDGRLLAARRGDGSASSDPLYRAAPSFGAPSGLTRLAGAEFVDGVPRVVAWQALDHYPLMSMAGISELDMHAGYHKMEQDYFVAAMGGSILLFLLAVTGTAYSARLAWRKQLAEDIRNTYLLAMEGGQEGFFMVRALYSQQQEVIDFVVEDCNERGAAYAGFSKEELLGTRFTEFESYPHLDKMLAVCRQAMATGFYEDEIDVTPRSHADRTWLHRRFVRSGPGLAVTVRDISDAKAHQESLSKMAHADALTGLPNRYWLMKYLPQALAGAAEGGTMMAVMFIDLDNFKSVNDTLGHAAGDELLQSASRRLAAAIRSGDKLARLGGDEFTIVLEQVERAEIIQVAERIVEAMSTPFVLANAARCMALASVGISVYPQDGAEVSTLLRHADLAMYRAKSGGKGQYRFYTPELNAGDAPAA
ncbi:MAG: diguanylate cyclase [Noviherbaspirillum sp.]